MLNPVATKLAPAQAETIIKARRRGRTMAAPPEQAASIFATIALIPGTRNAFHRVLASICVWAFLAAAIVSPHTSAFAKANGQSRAKVFLGYIDNDPNDPQWLLPEILEELSKQLGGQADTLIHKVPADWSISKDWRALGDSNYTHFVVGISQAAGDTKSQYMRPTWMIGKMTKDRDGVTHLTYYGALFLRIFFSRDSPEIKRYKNDCPEQALPALPKCMEPMLSEDAAGIIRVGLFRIFPDLREKYIFAIRCLQPTSDTTLDITQNLWDALSSVLGKPSADYWDNIELLRKDCLEPERIAALRKNLDPEFEISGNYSGSSSLNLKILNRIGDRRDQEVYAFALGDDSTSEEAHRWQDILETWPSKRMKCSIAGEDSPNWTEAIAGLAPHLTTVIVSQMAVEMSCTRFRRHRARCFMEREVRHGEKAVYTGVQA
jgi:hypothetical protein